MLHYFILHYTQIEAWSLPNNTPYVIGQCIYAHHQTYTYNALLCTHIMHIYIGTISIRNSNISEILMSEFMSCIEILKFLYVGNSDALVIPIHQNFKNYDMSKFLAHIWKIENSSMLEFPSNLSICQKFWYLGKSIRISKLRISWNFRSSKIPEYLIQQNSCQKFQYIRISEILICWNLWCIQVSIRVSDMSVFLGLWYVDISDTLEFLTHWNFWNCNFCWKFCCSDFLIC